MDYTFLRSQGITNLQNLGGKIWTDYNIHDPGVTILEHLCYAITELGYRTASDIKDLLATDGKATGQPKDFYTARDILTCNPLTIDDYRKLVIDSKGVRNAWFDPSKENEHPLYLNDAIEKLDYTPGKEKLQLKGLYNVLLEFEEDDELGDLNSSSLDRTITDPNEQRYDIAVNFPSWEETDAHWQKDQTIKTISIKDDELKFIAKDDFYAELLITTPASLSPFSLEVRITVLNSLAHLSDLAPMETVIKDTLVKTGEEDLVRQFNKKVVKITTIRNDVRRLLLSYRNLCEDFYQFKSLKIEEIAICADIELSPEADIAEVLAEIWYQIGKFISPSIKFYTINQLLEKGKTVDEIFEGPVLKHGFIDDDELVRLQRKDIIYTSDLVQIIMDVKGVVAVNKIELSSYINDQVINKGAKNCLKITLPDTHQPKLSIQKSMIAFFKDGTPYKAHKKSALAKLEEKKLLDKKPRLAESEYDIDPPIGTYLDLADYYPLQNEFPLNYGIGKEGLPDNAKPLRKAQARQLKAYMLFFEQLLSDYLAQLSHLKDLFSMGADIDSTYFTQPLYQVPRVAVLLHAFTKSLPPGTDLDDPDSWETAWKNFIKDDQNAYLRALDEIVEDKDTFVDRRNRFLDHLIARFSEDFSQYQLFALLGEASKTRMIDEKIRFLNDYPAISRDRGKAFNYKKYQSGQADVWNSGNVSGYKKRICRLLGIKDFNRNNIYFDYADRITSIKKYFHLAKAGQSYLFTLKDQDDQELLANKANGYSSEAKRKEIISKIVIFGSDACNYKSFYDLTTQRYTFQINDLDIPGNVLDIGYPQFQEEADSNQRIKDIVQLLRSLFWNKEGMHVVEHLLLRPKHNQSEELQDDLLPVHLDETDCECPVIKDPYSFRLTVVFPSWPTRFRDKDFRKYMEYMLRLETPAHLFVRICWIGRDQMKKFEATYKSWLEENAKPVPEPKLRSKKLNALIKILFELKNEYPAATLHDLDDDESSGSLLVMNKTHLGSL